ncbi:MAG: helix-turn-helix transcriptional regulator [Rhodobacteraceae bacterium]|nr:helix-turn-helix transcriptional regulator [Paracoccaceae bacterium]
MEKPQALDALAALANETRLDLVRMLIAHAPTGLAAGEIARHLGVSASRLSFHLSTLEQAGLIASRKESRHVYYAAETRHIGRLMGYLLNDCCRAHPEVSACCAHGRAVTPPEQ